MIIISEFTKHSLTKKGFSLDYQGELRYYGHLFWGLDKVIIEKQLREYSGNGIELSCRESYKFNVRR
jgi:hypothetical protein